MPSKRTFCKTTIEVTILSETPYSEPFTLEQVGYDITFGDCSGQFRVTTREEVDAQTMANLLMEQASDPAFFRLTNDGDDINEDEE